MLRRCSPPLASTTLTDSTVCSFAVLERLPVNRACDVAWPADVRSPAMEMSPLSPPRPVPCTLLPSPRNTRVPSPSNWNWPARV